MMLTVEAVVVMVIALPLVAAPVAMLVTGHQRLSRWLVVMTTITAAGAYGLALVWPDQERELLGGVVRIDATARLFLTLVDFIAVGVATYLAGRTSTVEQHLQAAPRFTALVLTFLGLSNLAILSNHLVAGWVALEATTLCAVPLILHRQSDPARVAAWRYFLMSTVGLALTMVGFACLDHSLSLDGTVEVEFFIDELTHASHQPTDLWGRVGVALVFLGYGTKLGLAPMYAWLPDTYEASLPSVTVLLSAVQFNAALVGVLRVFQVFRNVNQEFVSVEFSTLGIASMAVSVFGLVTTTRYKRLIAYAAVNHGGVIAVGLGIGRKAAYGVVLYVVSNAIIKAILFLSAGRIRAHYRTDDVREVSSLIRDLPYSGLVFAVGVFALLGFPPFGSFLGEMLIMSELIRGGYYSLFAAFCGLLTLAFVATGRLVFPMLWGAPHKPPAGEPQRVTDFVPKLVLLGFLVAMGLYLPPQISVMFRQVADSLGSS